MLEVRGQANDEMSSLDERLGLAVAVQFVRRWAWLLLIGVILGGLIGAIYATSAEPRYVAAARLLLERPRSASPAGDPGLVQFSLDTSQIESQIQVILSESTTRRVVGELGLQSDPEFTSPRTSALGSILTIARSILSGPPSEVVPQSEDSSTDQIHRILTVLDARLGARRIGQSYVIEVSFWSSSPDKAARITNAVAAAFIGNQLEARATIAESGGELIAKRLEDLRINVITTQEAVRTGLIDVHSFPSADVRVITAASPPLGKSWPRTNLMVLLGSLVGLLLMSLLAMRIRS